MPEYDVLLFQLDSIEDIMWGDCGVAKILYDMGSFKEM